MSKGKILTIFIENISTNLFIYLQQRKQKALEEARNRAEITEQQMPQEPEEEDYEKDELDEDIVVTKL